MKRLLTLFALCALVSCVKNEGYVIDGRIDGLQGEISLVDMYDHVISSSPIKDGRFRFEGIVDNPQLMYLNNGLGQEYPMDTPILLENAKLKVRGDVKTYDITVSGTLANENMTEYIRRKKKLDEMDIDSYVALVKETFYDNSDNLLGSMMIPNLAPYISSEELIACCEMLPDYVRETKVISHYETVAHAVVGTSVGHEFVDFAVEGANGPVYLSSTVSSAKMTVFVLWATWARSAFDVLSDYVKVCKPYESEGLTMFSVSLDYNKEQWAEMSANAGLFGVNICDTPEKGLEISNQYGIEGYPRAVIIDSEGIIVGRCKDASEIKEVLESHFDKQ